MENKGLKIIDSEICVSVIVPAFNAPEHLALLLKSLDNQSVRNFEVIVVDDGSADGTRQVVESMEESFTLPLYYFYLDNTGIFGAGIARNYGARHARGDILLFLDQDCVAEENLVKRHIEAHKDKDVVLGYYAGYGDEKDHYNFLVLRESVRQKSVVPVKKDFRDQLFRDGIHADAWKCFVSAHFSIKKEVFQDFCFDESFIQWGCEDVDLGYRIFKSGKIVHFSRECVVYNSSQDLQFTRKKFLTLAQSLIQIYEKYQTEELKLYCFERFYHVPVKYRGTLLLLFLDGRLEVRDSQTRILINKNCRAFILLGHDFPEVVSAVKGVIPLIVSICFDFGVIKNIESSRHVIYRSAFHEVIKLLRDEKVAVNFEDIRKQSFLAGFLLLGPKMLDLTYYNRCNLRCLFCSGYTPLGMETRDGSQPISFAEIESILVQAYEIGVETVRLSSEGDPLISPDIANILKSIAQKGFKLHILTNGAAIKKEHILLLDKIHNEINVLINFGAAKKGTYRALHGGSLNSYESVLRSLSALSGLRRLKNKRGERIFVGTTFVITKVNFREIADYINLVSRACVDHVYFKLAVLNEKTEQIRVGTTDMEPLRKELLKAELLRRKLSVSANIGDMLKKFSDTKNRQKNSVREFGFNLSISNCYNGWFYGRISSCGDYYICCRGTEPIGNIVASSLKGVVFSSRMNSVLKEGASGISLDKKMWRSCIYCDHSFDNKTARTWLGDK